MARNSEKAGTQEAVWTQINLSMGKMKQMSTAHTSCMCSGLLLLRIEPLLLHDFLVKVEEIWPRGRFLIFKQEHRQKEGRGVVGWYSNILRNPRRLPKECGAGGSILKT